MKWLEEKTHRNRNFWIITLIYLKSFHWTIQIKYKIQQITVSAHCNIFLLKDGTDVTLTAVNANLPGIDVIVWLVKLTFRTFEQIWFIALAFYIEKFRCVSISLFPSKILICYGSVVTTKNTNWRINK